METYEWANKTYRAWSEMQCNEADKHHTEHMPHTWNAEYVRFGPYMCWGYPNHKDKLPTEDELKVLVGEQMDKLWWLREYIPNAAPEAKAFDAIRRWLDGKPSKNDS